MTSRFGFCVLIIYSMICAHEPSRIFGEYLFLPTSMIRDIFDGMSTVLVLLSNFADIYSEVDCCRIMVR